MVPLYCVEEIFEHWTLLTITTTNNAHKHVRRQSAILCHTAYSPGSVVAHEQARKFAQFAACHPTPQLSRLGPYNLSTFDVKVPATTHAAIRRQSHCDTICNSSTSKSQLHHVQPFKVKFTSTPHTIIQRQIHRDITCNRSTSKSLRYHMQQFNVKVTATPRATIQS